MSETKSPSSLFDGQVAIVTGAGHGLGRDYAVQLAEHGAQVVVNDIGRDADGAYLAEEVVAYIRSIGGRATANTDSVADSDGAEALVKTAVDQFGRLDALINNAGIVRGAPFESASTADLDDMYSVHVRGSFMLSQNAFRIMKKQGYGRIVNTTSGAGMFGMLNMSTYAIAKASILGLTNMISLEGEEFGVIANAVLPIAQTVPGRTESAVRLYQSLGRLEPRVTVEFVTPLVLHLASRSCTAGKGIYSAVAGRYAMAFVGLTQGWISDDDVPPSAERISEMFPHIIDQQNYDVPLSIADEVASVGLRTRREEVPT